LVSVANVLLVGAVGALTGTLGAALGIGGGVFLVPLLVLGLDVPIRTAAGISLVAVIATSSAVTARSRVRNLINLRLGMLLEVATTTGGLTGGLTTRLVPEHTLIATFAVASAGIGIATLSRLRHRNIILDPDADIGWLGSRFHEEESGGLVSYRVRRLPLAFGASFVAGTLSSLLGIGGGVLKVPVLNTWCGVPMRVAAATTAFLVGVTAVSAVPLYYAHGDIVPPLAAAAVLGVLAGSRAGFRLTARAQAKWLKVLLACVLFLVSALMFARL